MANDNNNKTPNPDNPVVPEDYNPDHANNYPHGMQEVVGEKDKHPEPFDSYETDVRDENDRVPGKPSKYIVPGEEDASGQGWTLPSSKGGGWEHPPEVPMEEQIEEPETPQDIKNK